MRLDKKQIRRSSADVDRKKPVLFQKIFVSVQRRAQRPSFQTDPSVLPIYFRGRRPADDRPRPEDGRHWFGYHRRHDHHPVDGLEETKPSRIIKKIFFIFSYLKT